MKRSVKNIIMIVLIGIICGLIFFTMNYAKNNISSSNQNEMMMQGENSNMPSMPANQSGTQDENLASGDNNEATMQEAPEKPEGDSSTMEEPPEKPEGDSTTMEEPPEKPEGDSTTMEEPPAKPDEDSTTTEGSSQEENTQSTEQMPSMPTEQGGMDSSMQPAMSETLSLTTMYYVVFGAESVVLSLLVMYIIMSAFNKKSFKETFANVDKIVIYVLLIVILSVALTFGEKVITEKYFLGNSENTQNAQGGQMSSSSSVTYSGVEEITEDTTIDSGSYSSTEKDQNAILVTGDIDVSLSNIEVNKTGDSDGGDNSNFYGNNSGIIAKDGANLTLNNITVTTAASGANGVFSYGGSATTNNSSSDGTTVTISDSKITTTGDNSGGIMTTGGGIMNAYNLTIDTAGTSSAAIRTDRGGGTVTVDGGTYTTTGQGSPAIYSTADITVSNASLIAKASEGIVIEGKNSVSIDSCDLVDSNTKLNGKSTTYKNIFIYQSMSGDAAQGNATFTAKNSNITTNNGDTLYVTNTTATINLENNTIVNNDNSGNFLRIQKDSWGNEGSNGGDVTLVMKNQKATGNIVVDSISTLDITMSSSSYYEGAINSDNTAKSIALKLDSSSKIKLTADSYVTSLEDADTSYSNIDFNGYTLYVNGTAIN